MLIFGNFVSLISANFVVLISWNFSFLKFFGKLSLYNGCCLLSRENPIIMIYEKAIIDGKLIDGKIIDEKIVDGKSIIWELACYLNVKQYLGM